MLFSKGVDLLKIKIGIQKGSTFCQCGGGGGNLHRFNQCMLKSWGIICSLGTLNLYSRFYSGHNHCQLFLNHFLIFNLPTVNIKSPCFNFLVCLFCCFCASETVIYFCLFTFRHNKHTSQSTNYENYSEQVYVQISGIKIISVFKILLLLF